MTTLELAHCFFKTHIDITFRTAGLVVPRRLSDGGQHTTFDRAPRRSNNGPAPEKENNLKVSKVNVGVLGAEI